MKAWIDATLCTPGPFFEGFSHADRASLRIVLNGTFYTQDALHHIGESDLPCCPACGARDSIFHRTGICPALEATRRAAFGFLLQPELLPPCLANHGWVHRPEGQDALWQMLLQVPGPSPDFLCRLHTAPQYDLFTDGSSAFRAEMLAVQMAWQFAIIFRRRVRIWCGCLGVVRRVQGFLHGSRVAPTSRNADIWCPIKEQVDVLGESFLGIFKISAHEDFQESEDELGRWCYYNNHLVDKAANRANLDRPARFWETWDEVRKQYSYQRLEGERVLRVHLAVAKAVRRWDQVSVRATGEVAFPTAPALEVPACGEDRLREVFAKYSRAFVLTLLNWLRLVSGPTVDASPRWISFAQLYIAFHKMTGVRAPFLRSRGIVLETTRSHCFERSRSANGSHGFSLR